MIFDYSKYEKLLLPQELVGVFARIKAYQGKKEPFIGEESAIKDFKPMKSLRETVRIQSAVASCRIEGIHTTEAALEKAVKNNTEPKTHDEQESRGLLEVLKTIEDSFLHIPCKPNYILQLHKTMYKFTTKNIGGQYKNGENAITEERSDGTKIVRFNPLSAFETPNAVASLCDEFNKALDFSTIDSLLLIPIFILDFLCIHPFSDGNGRLSRALTSLLLFREGYLIGLYSSIEAQIENTRSAYYDALEASSEGWHDGKNDVIPFIRYFLNTIYAAYVDFENMMKNKDLSKPDQIKALFDDSLKKLTKAEIRKALPFISESTIEITLKELVGSGYVIKEGSTRNTFYIKNREKQ